MRTFVFLTILISGGVIAQNTSPIWQQQSNPSPGADEATKVFAKGGFVYVAGSQNLTGPDDQWRIEKRNVSDGTLVTAFDTDGILTINPSSGDDGIEAMAVDVADNAIYIAGFDNTPGPGSFSFRWRIDRINMTTGATVWSQTNSLTGDSIPEGIVFDSTDVYIVGSDSANGGQWRIEKRAKLTGVSSGFGTVTENISADKDQPLDVATDGANLFICGNDSVTSTDREWRIEKRSMSTGALVSGFGNGGIISFNPSGLNDEANGIVFDGNSLFIIGDDMTPGNKQWRIESRDAATGALSPCFGDNGVVLDNPSQNDDEAKGLIVDGEFIYVAGFDRGFGPSNAAVRFSKMSRKTGMFVSNFGFSGSMTLNPSNGDDFAKGIATDSTAFYIAGVDSNPGNMEWFVEKRAFEDGAQGSQGLQDNVSSGNDRAICAAIDKSAAFIYVAGFDETAGIGNSEWRIIKIDLAQGAPVTSFGTSGIVTSNPSSFGDEPRAIVIDNANMFVAGFDSSPGSGNTQWRIEKRSLSTGGLIGAFGTSGVVQSNLGAGTDTVFAIALDSTSLYVVGSDSTNGASNHRWRIEKRNAATGALDTSFGASGLITSEPGSFDDLPFAVLLDPVSSVFFVGGAEGQSTSTWQWRLEKRSTSTGALVTAFGSSGVLNSNSSNAGNPTDKAMSLAGDGTAIFATSFVQTSGDSRWQIEKRDVSTGALVAGFGNGGVADSNPSPTIDAPAFSLVAAGGIIVGGFDESRGASNRQWRFEKRSLATGLLDGHFGFEGVVVQNPSEGQDQPLGSVSDGTQFYIGGFDSVAGNEGWRLDALRIFTGTSGGSNQFVVTNDPSTNNDEPLAVARDSMFIYIAGYDGQFGTSNNQWHIEKRKLGDGTTDFNFGQFGTVQSNPSANDDRAMGISVDSTYMYIIGTDNTGGTSSVWRIEKRKISDGTLVSAFGSGGVVTTGIAALSDGSASIIADGASIFIVVEEDVGGPDTRWHIEKRNSTTGLIDTSFATSGIYISNPTINGDLPIAVAIDTQFLYVAGLQNETGPTSNAAGRIEKINKATGGLDGSFGTSGAVVSDPSTGFDAFRGIAIDSTNMYVAGSDSVTGSPEFRIEKRLLSTGSTVAAFGSSGVITFDASSNTDRGMDIVIDSNALYFIGFDSINSATDSAWHVQKRSLSNGALVGGFGVDGILRFSPTNGDDETARAVIDSTTLHIVGFDTTEGGTPSREWRYERRRLGDGTQQDPAPFEFKLNFPPDGDKGTILTPMLSWDMTSDVETFTLEVSTVSNFSTLAFQQTGIPPYQTSFTLPSGSMAANTLYFWRVFANSSAGSILASNAPFSFITTANNNSWFVPENVTKSVDGAFRIVRDATSMYVVGGDAASGDLQWRIEKRNLSDGKLDSAFGTGGIVQSDPSCGFDIAYNIAIDASNIYVAGTDESSGAGNASWRVEKRDKTTGALVTAFGTNGAVVSNPTGSSGIDNIVGIATDSTSMYVIGFRKAGNDSFWRIEKRSLTTGAIDASFGTSGVIEINPTTTAGANDDFPLHAAVDSGFLYVVGFQGGGDQGTIENPPGAWRIEKRNATTGALISGFGSGGVINSGSGTQENEATSIIVDSANGVLYVGGWDEVNGGTGGDRRWRVEKRLITDGTLVSSFGNAGVYTANFSIDEDEIQDMAMDSTSLYLVGNDRSAGTNVSRWRVEKHMLPNGGLDGTFGSGGVMVSKHGMSDELNGIAIDSTSIYLAGYGEVTMSTPGQGPGDIAIMIHKRSIANGSVGFGFTPTNFSLTAPPNGITGLGFTPGLMWTDAHEENNYTVEISTVSDFASLVYQTTVGADIVTFTIPNGILQPNTTYFWRIKAVNGIGNTLASNSPFSFTTGTNNPWLAGVNPTPSGDEAFAVAKDSSAIYVVGYGGANGNDWRIEKRDINTGALVTAFGSSGVVDENVTAGDDEALAVAVDSVAVYIVGYQSTGNGAWRIEKRNKTDGSLVSGFGSGGAIVEDVSAGDDRAQDIALDGQFMYVVGYDLNGSNSRFRIEKRDLATGNLDPSFGVGGVSTSSVINTNLTAEKLIIDSQFMYVIGFATNGPTWGWRLEKRYLANASFDGTFGTFGVIDTNLGNGGFANDVDIALDTSVANSPALIIAGVSDGGTNQFYHVERRFAGNGSLDLGFGSSGIVTEDPSSGFDNLHGIAIDPNSNTFIIVGADASNANRQWRYEKRFVNSGALDNSFGLAGVRVSNPSSGDDIAFGIVIDNLTMYTVGMDNVPTNPEWRIERRSLADGSLPTANVGPLTLTAGQLGRSSQDFPMATFAIQAASGNLNVSAIAISSVVGGGGAQTDIASILVYNDFGNAGQVDFSDQLLGFGTLSGSSATIPVKLNVPENNTMNLLVVYRMAGTAALGSTFTANVTGITSDSVATSGLPINGSANTVRGTLKFLGETPVVPTHGVLAGTNNSAVLHFTVESDALEGVTMTSLAFTIFSNDLVTSQHLMSIAMIDANTAVAVGTGGVIIRTLDAGKNWQRMNSGTVSDLFGVSFLDGSNGFAVGANGTIVKTTDGGLNWNSSNSGVPNVTYRDVHFKSSTQAWAVGSSGTIVTTGNGGSSWSTQTSGTGNNLNAVHFVNTTFGWAAGDAGTIVTTSNGGSTWGPQTSPVTDNLNDISFINGSNGWICGDSGKILVTTNGGSLWSTQTSGTTNKLNGIFMADINTGWTVGAAGTILKYTSGTWAAQTSNSNVALNGVFFVGSSFVKVVGNSGKIIQSDNSGTNWNSGPHTQSGSGGNGTSAFPPDTISSARLYEDLNNNGRLDAGEPQIGSALTDFDNVAPGDTDGMIHFNGLSFVLPASTLKGIILVTDVSPLAPVTNQNGPGLMVATVRPYNPGSFFAAVGNSSTQSAAFGGIGLEGQFSIVADPRVHPMNGLMARFEAGDEKGPRVSNGHITAYRWDFDNSGTDDYTSATEPNAVFTYSAAGTYTAVFKVDYSDGQTITRTTPGIVISKFEKDIATVDLDPSITAKAFEFRTTIGRQSTQKVYIISEPSALLVIDMDPASANFNKVTDRVALPGTGEQGYRSMVLSEGTNRLYALREGGIPAIVSIDISGASPVPGTAINLPATFEVDDMLVSPSLKRLFMLNSHQTSGVKVIDINPASGTFHQVIMTIPVGGDAHKFALKDSTNQLYVSKSDGSMFIVNASNGNILRSINLGGGGGGGNAELFNAANNRLYVLERFGSKRINIYNTNSDAFESGINLSLDTPLIVRAQQVAPFKVYVVVNSAGGNYVLIIGGDPNAGNFNQIIGSISLPGSSDDRFSEFILNDATSRMYIGEERRTWAIDTNSDSIVANTFHQLATEHEEGDNQDPASAVLNAASNKLYEFSELGVVRMFDNTSNSIAAVFGTGPGSTAAAIDSAINKVYVDSADANGLRIIDTKTFNQTASFSTSFGNLRVQLNANKTYAYLIDFIAQKIRAIKISDGSATLIPLSPFALASDIISGDILLNANTNRLYVTGTAGGQKKAWIIDTNPASGTFNTQIGVVNLGPDGRRMVLNPSNNKIYFGPEEGGTSFDIIFDNPASVPTSSSNISAPGTILGFDVNTSTNKFYLANVNGLPQLTVYNGTTDALITSVGLPDDAGTVKVHNAANRVYVAARDKMQVVNGATDTLLTTIPMHYGPPEKGEEGDRPGILIDESRNRLFLIGGRSVLVINAAANALLGELPLTSASAALLGADEVPALEPLTGRVFLPSVNGTVHIVGTGSAAVTAGAGNPGAGNILSYDQNVVMAQINVANSPIENATITSMSFAASGTGNDTTAMSSIRLVHDIDNNGVADGTDPEIDFQPPYSSDNGTLTFSVNIPIAANNNMNFLLVHNYNGTASVGQTFQVTFTGLLATGSDTNRPLFIDAPATIPGGLKTVIAGPFGVAVSDSTSGDDSAIDIATDGSFMYVAGYDSTGGNRWRVEKRSLSNGTLDTSFASSGVYTDDLGTGDDRAQAIAVDGSFVYVAGFQDNAGDSQWVIEKLSKTTGALDTSFGTGGRVTSNPSSGIDRAVDIVIDSTAMYVIGGSETGFDMKWRIEKRLLSTGALFDGAAASPQFAVGGILQINPNPSGSDNPTGIALDIPTGFLFAIGEDSSAGSGMWRVQKISATDGSFDTTNFGSPNGFVTSDPNASFSDAPKGIALDGTNMFVVGTETVSASDTAWRIEKRSMLTGSLVTSFDSDGFLTSNPAGNSAVPFAITRDASGIYIAGKDDSNGDEQWRIEKRNPSTGALDSSFGSGGVVLSNPSQNNDVANGAAVDSVALYIVGDDEIQGLKEWRIERRNLTSGNFLFGPPGAFTLATPTSGTTGLGLTPTLTWLDATGEASYTVEIDTENTFAAPLTFTTSVSSNVSSFTVPSATLSAGTLYFWRVIAVNGVGNTIATNAPFSFTTNTLPGSLTLTAPSNGATGQSTTPTFTWTNATNESGYILQVTLPADTSFASSVIDAQTIPADSTSFVPNPGDLTIGATYIWRVIAVNNVGSTTASNANFTFTVNSLPTAFNLTAPSNGATGLTLTPTLTWTDSSGETTYTLEMASDSGMTNIFFSNSSIAANTTTFNVPTSTLSTGQTVFWRILGVNNVGSTVAANAPFSFTTNNPPGNFSLVSPSDGSINVSLTPTITWTDAANESSYTLEVSTSSSFGTLTFSNSSIAANTTSFNIPSSTLAAGTLYFFRVKAVNNVQTDIAGNAPFSFTTVGPPASFSLSNPSNGATGQALTVNLGWTDSSNEDSYTVQLSTSNTFASFIVNSTVAQNTTTFLVSSGLSAATQYFWRIIAVNTAGNTTASNAPFSFTTDNPPSGTVSDGLSGDIDFQNNTTAISANWTITDPESGISQFEWAIGTSPSGTDILAFTSVGTATSQTQSGLTLTPGATYFVSVRATNGNNMQTVVSSDGVTVDTTAPSASGAAQATDHFVPSGGTFILSWTSSSSSDVSFYEVYASNNGGSSFSLLGSSNGGSFTVSSGLSSGKWIFKVRTYDLAGNSTDSSNSIPVYFDKPYSSDTCPRAVDLNVPVSVDVFGQMMTGVDGIQVGSGSASGVSSTSNVANGIFPASASSGSVNVTITRSSPPASFSMPSAFAYANSGSTFNLDVPPGSVITDYRMITLPVFADAADLQNFLVATFGGYDITHWRAFWWNGSGYLEFPSFANSGDLCDLAGYSIWVLSRNAGTIAATGLHTSDTSMVYVKLHPGWNMVGNPFQVTKQWCNVLVGFEMGDAVAACFSNDYILETPAFFTTGGYVIPTNPASLVLPVGEGFWVYNKTNDDVILYFSNLLAAPDGSSSPSGMSQFKANGISAPPGAPGDVSTASSGAVASGSGGGGCFVGTPSGGNGILNLALVGFLGLAVIALSFRILGRHKA